MRPMREKMHTGEYISLMTMKSFRIRSGNWTGFMISI